jgi:PKD repeat protein
MLRTRLNIAIIVWFSILAPCLMAQVTFVKRAIDPSAAKISGLWAEDLDNDGDWDIVACERTVNQLVVWKNKGGMPLQWSKTVVGNGVIAPLYVCAGDFDGDGLNDVAASSGTAGSVSWWRNDGGSPTGWVRQDIQTGFTQAHAVYPADIDGDGALDIVGTAASLNQVVWWRNGGGNPIVWTKQNVSSNFRTTQTAMAADIDGDSMMDIVAGSSDNDEVAWWRNGGGDPIVWTKQTIGSGFDLAHWVHACDINGDGHMDVVGAAYIGGEVAWWRNSGTAPIVWTKQTIQSGFTCALNVHAGDFDNDGELDVVGSSTCTMDDITWWHNSGEDSITWTANDIDANYNGGWPVIACDLDGDGDQDVVAGADAFEGGVALPLTWWENRLIVHLEFSNTPSWGWSPLPVDFQAVSTHDVMSWNWAFGDGDSAYVQSPSHIYQTPGTYDVSVRIESPDTTLSLILEDRISVLADSVIAGDGAGAPSSIVEVVVQELNFAPLRKIVLPVEYSGGLWLKLDSYSIDGCRSEAFDSVKQTYLDSATRRTEFTFFNSDSTVPALSVGQGALLKLRFHVASNAPGGATSAINLVGFAGHPLRYYSTAFDYAPVGMASTVTLTALCGDANADQGLDISDAVYLIAFIFTGGPAPAPMAAGNVNCDSSVDISDVVYLISHIFVGGPPPCSDCK